MDIIVPTGICVGDFIIGIISFSFKDGNFDISLSSPKVKQISEIIKALSDCGMETHISFEEEVMSIETKTSIWGVRKIFESLASTTSATEEDIVESTQYEIDGDKYRFVKVGEETEKEDTVETPEETKSEKTVDEMRKKFYNMKLSDRVKK